MSRARNIKPGFFKNDLLAECDPLARLLFAALWCEADREGRLEYRPRRIKAECVPYDDVNVEDAVADLVERGFLIIYESGGSQYIQVRNWTKHQNPHHKEVGSTIPPPDGHVDTVCAGYIPLSNTIRNRIYERDGRVCKECGATHGLSIDHVVPVSRGGNSTDDNLQVLCLGCNVRKGNKFHASVMDEPCIDHASVKENASCPTDSLNLIPDSIEKISALRAEVGLPSDPVPPGAMDSPQDPTDAGSPKRNACPVAEIVALYHETLPQLPHVEKITKTRASYLRQRWLQDLPTLDAWRNYFTDVSHSPFLTGKAAGSNGKPPFVADLEWLTRPSNFVKVAEGKYHRA